MDLEESPAKVITKYGMNKENNLSQYDHDTKHKARGVWMWLIIRDYTGLEELSQLPNPITIEHHCATLKTR
jgi:hypothetical protein